MIKLSDCNNCIRDCTRKVCKAVKFDCPFYAVDTRKIKLIELISESSIINLLSVPLKIET